MMKYDTFTFEYCLVKLFKLLLSTGTHIKNTILKYWFLISAGIWMIQ